jgi:hypothetical protein
MYDAAIVEAAKATPLGDSIEIVHEADKKIVDGATTWPVVLAAKNHFYEVAKAANPNVLVVNTITGWTAEPTSGRDLQRWGQIKADVLGIDADGINPTSGSYPNYESEIKAAVAFIKTFAGNGYRHWSVPEFGSRRMQTDATGVNRIAWALDYAAKFEAAGARSVDWYDYDMDGIGDAFSLQNEIDAWRSVVAN